MVAATFPAASKFLAAATFLAASLRRLADGIGCQIYTRILVTVAHDALEVRPYIGRSPITSIRPRAIAVQLLSFPSFWDAPTSDAGTRGNLPSHSIQWQFFHGHLVV